MKATTDVSFLEESSTLFLDLSWKEKEMCWGGDSFRPKLQSILKMEESCWVQITEEDVLAKICQKGEIESSKDLTKFW